MKAFDSIDNWFCVLKINSILYLVILYGRTIAVD
jgi:L-asparagine transporter-like permease